MNHCNRTPRASIAIAVFALAAGAAIAQAPQLPPAEAVDPVKLETMKGFPPQEDKVVRLGNVLRFPNQRWAFHHMRQLGPTVQVWRGDGAPSPLRESPKELDQLGMPDGKGGRTTLADWQRATYTDAIMVLHKGRVLYQKHYVGMQPHQPHALWSMSKSFVGLLATMLIHEGQLDPVAPVSRYIPELANSAWADATVQQTLDMTVGAQYEENFRDPASGIFQYLYAASLLPAPAGYAGPKTLADMLVAVKKEGEHGTGFRYKSVNTEVMGWVIQRVTGKSFAQLMTERIWSRIGAQDDAYVWVDPNGAHVTSIGLNATLRDLARFGEMIRTNGRFGGRQVVPEAVIAEIRKGADPEKFKASGQAMRAGYSYHNFWWIPHDKDGTFEIKGLNGQHLHVNPAAELVIVKLSSHPADTSATHAADRAAFDAIAAAVRSH